MFAVGAGMWGGIAPPPENLFEKERAPVARPLPLEFPEFKPSASSEPLTSQRMRELRHSLIQFRRPGGANDDFFKHFNIHMPSQIHFTDFVPKEFMPKRPFLFDSDLEAMMEELDFDNEDAFREVLRLPPLEGKTKPRLKWSRHFYAALEDLSRYYDESKDNYYSKHVSPDGKEETSESNTNGIFRSLNPIPSASYSSIGTTRRRTDVDREAERAAKIAAGIDLDELDPDENVFDDPSISNDWIKKDFYMGHRLGNASQCPPTTRNAVVRSLMKMLVSAFGCRDTDISPRERLVIKDVIIPPQMITYTFHVTKMPKDRELAKARMMEGPVMSVYSRHEAIWKEETLAGLADEGRNGNEVGEYVGEEMDCIKEIGGLLMLAMQRNRAGKGTKDEYWGKGMQDWWWAKKPRWGGGEVKWGNSAFEQYEDEDPSWSPAERELQFAKREKEAKEKRILADVAGDKVEVEDLIADTSKDEDGMPKKKKSKLGLASRLREKKNGSVGNGEEKAEYRDGKRLVHVPVNRKQWFQNWTEIKPNPNPWDEKMIYRKIGEEKVGKDLGTDVHGKEDQWDTVFQIGCVNHHVNLVRLRVSKRYLRWLETGVGEEPGKEKVTTDEEEEGKGKGREGHGASGMNEDENQDVITLHQTSWYDLFNQTDRQNFLCNMWRIMSWIMRNEVDRSVWEKREQMVTT